MFTGRCGHMNAILWFFLGNFSTDNLEKDGGQLDRSCAKWSITQSQGQQYPTDNKKEKGNWIGHFVRRNCLIKHVIEGEIEEGTEMTGRRERRSKQLLYDLKEMKGNWKLKEEALYRSVWWTRFGRGYGSVVSETVEWMKLVVPCRREFKSIARARCDASLQ